MDTGFKEKDDITIDKIHKYLEKEKIDAFIPSKPQHIGYLTNYYDYLHTTSIPWYEMISFLVVPLKNDAFITGVDNHYAGLPEFGVAPWWLKERYTGGRPAQKGLEELVDILKKKGLERKRIGLEFNWIQMKVYEYLKSALPDAEFVSADLLIPQIRLIKTTREINLLKKSANIAMKSMELYMENIRSGINRQDAEKNRAKNAIDLGGEWLGGGYSTIWTGGVDYTPDWWDTEAREKISSARIRNYANLPYDFPCLITHYGCKYQYYLSDLAWHEFYNDEPDPDKNFLWGTEKVTYSEAVREFELIRRVQKEALELIKPGMNHIEANKKINNYLIADKEASKKIVQYYIHSLGLEVHEEPIFTLYSEPFEEKKPNVPTPADGLIYIYPGTVLSSEWFTPLWTVEEPFVMTEKGWEPLVELRGIIR